MFVGVTFLHKGKEIEVNTSKVIDGLTVEGYAKEFVNKAVDMYENAEYGSFKIVDSKMLES